MRPAIRITLSPTSPVPGHTSGPWVVGVMKLTTGPAIDDWDNQYIVDAESFGERVNIVKGGNYVQLLSSSVTLSNHDGWWNMLNLVGASMDGAKVEVGSVADDWSFTVYWRGVVESCEPCQEGVHVSIEHGMARIHRELPARRLTSAEFPNLASASEGAVVPILYGADIVEIKAPSVRTTQDLPVTYIVGSMDKFTSWKNTSNGAFAGAADMVTAPYIMRYGAAMSAPWADVYALVAKDGPTWVSRVISGEDVYVKVTSGKGSGQTRKLTTLIVTSIETVDDGRTEILFAQSQVTVPWDTVPDGTSEFGFYVVDVAAKVVVGDEATVSRVYIKTDDGEFPIAHVQTAESGFVTADISSEFKDGENYSAFAYVVPAQAFGHSVLNDRNATLDSAHWNTMSVFSVNALTIGSGKIADAFCRTKVYMDEYPSGAETVRKLNLNFSVRVPDITKLRVVAVGKNLFGFEEILCDGTQTLTEISGTDFNNYSPTMVDGGEYGRFSAYEVSVSLTKPLSAYESVRAMLVYNSGTEFTQLNGLRYGTYDGSVYVYIAYDQFATWVAECVAIRPFWSDNTTFTSSRASVGGVFVGDSADWRNILDVTLVMSGSDPVAWKIKVDSVFDIAAGFAYDYVLVKPSSLTTLVTVNEAEAGYSTVFSSVSPDSGFLVDCAYGRHDDLVQYTLSREALIDICRTDLELSLFDYDYDMLNALPAEPVRMALTEKIMSDKLFARLAEQYNWIIYHGHGGAVHGGAVKAVEFLSKIGSTTYDYDVDTGDIVEDSIDGLDPTDTTDIVNLPTVQYDHTPASGYRKVGVVLDVKKDVSTLTPDNYLRTISGFGDFGKASSVYSTLHDSFTLYGYQNSGTFDFPDAGSSVDNLLFPSSGMGRLTWAAARKMVATFDVVESSACAGMRVGSRVRFRHKRFTGNGYRYGTCVAWSWNLLAEDATFTVSVMLDPVVRNTGTMFVVDTIDPTTTIDTLKDKLDSAGVVDKYTDSLGA